MTATEIKQFLREKRIYQWEVAKALGITEFTLTRWLREDLPVEKADQIMTAIREIQRQRKSETEEIVDNCEGGNKHA